MEIRRLCALAAIVVGTTAVSEARAQSALRCGPAGRGRPTSDGQRCECNEPGFFEQVRGGVHRCVPRPPQARRAAGVAPRPNLGCAGGEHVSSGHCCRTGQEWVPSVARCVCVDPSLCGPPAVPAGVAAAPSAPASPVTQRPSTAQPAQPPSTSCAEGMVLVSVTSTGRGARPGEPRPGANFCIHETEVTVDQYRACVAARGCTSPEETQAPCNDHDGVPGDHPINCVSWNAATRFCRWAGGRLPTEAEWAFAASGGEQDRLYPWGSDAPERRVCWQRSASSGTCGVRTLPADRSPFGVLDMAGNVGEWTADWHEPEHTRAVRGGAWDTDDDDGLRVTARRGYVPTRGLANIGFRCVQPPR